MYLGIDGGGSKTAFALVDRTGRVLARHDESGLYHPEIGLDGVAQVLRRGVSCTLSAAGLPVERVTFAFVGLPAYGEDAQLQPQLDALPSVALPPGRYGCGNDVVCSWAGSLACEDGISVVAGTGSIAYGRIGARSARAGGWGELLGDEGSAYWIAREGLALFAQMSDGRLPRGPLHEIVRRELRLGRDLELCAWVYGSSAGRCELARLAPLVTQAANAGDLRAQALLASAAAHLAELVVAVRGLLGAPPGKPMAVSYSGGLFHGAAGLLDDFCRALQQRGQCFSVRPPLLAPAIGAALFAAQCAGTPLDREARATLAGQHAAGTERAT
ncbi:MAG: BadF/BadG/BcrA/BcrD ATPase family protein [Pseudomonadota bacterium]